MRVIALDGDVLEQDIAEQQAIERGQNGHADRAGKVSIGKSRRQAIERNQRADHAEHRRQLGSLRAATSAAADKQMTSTITGARDWRREGIVHKKNEVFIDVDESVNLLVSSNGTVLKNDVVGAS